MSQWTHITATLAVDTWLWGMSKEGVMSLVQSKLDEAPEITGSEGGAEVNFFVKRGHNQSSRENGEWLRAQSCVTIVIQGDLRDRDKEEVEKELSDFVNYIADEYLIRDGSYGLVDDWTGSETGLIEDLIKDKEEEK